MVKGVNIIPDYMFRVYISDEFVDKEGGVRECKGRV